MSRPSPADTIVPWPAPARAKREVFSGEGRSLKAQLMIRPAAAPDLVTAVDEIEEYGLWNDGHADGTNSKPALRFPQEGLHPACSIETEGETARKNDGIRSSDRSSKVYRVEFAGSRAASEDGGGGRGRHSPRAQRSHQSLAFRRALGPR